MIHLTNKKILAVEISTCSRFLKFHTDKGIFTYYADGDCAFSYFYQVEGFHGMSGATCFDVDMGEVKRQSSHDDCYCLDTQFIRLAFLGKGHATIEMRTEHNGYYFGHAVLVDQTNHWAPAPDNRTVWSKLS